MIAIGIDLGSKSSCIGAWINDHIEIITNNLDKRKTPSYVSFKNKKLLIGDEAFHKAETNIKNTAYSIKQLIGRDSDDIKSDIKYGPFNVIKINNKPYFKIENENKIETYSPEIIASMIITKLKETAESYLNQTITNAVIAVPASFNDSQRKATICAGNIAGFKNLQIINEPTATALSYNYNNSKNNENILIIDLGEGIYEVSIIQIRDSNITVKATACDNLLRGEDFTNRLVDYFINKVNENCNIDIYNQPTLLYSLKRKCEKTKCDLSLFTEASIEVDYLDDFSCDITRDLFEELCSDLFSRIIKPIEHVLNDSKLHKLDINEIVLVGGSTRIPKFRNIISSYFNGKKINKTVNADEAVTYGAVIQASILFGEVSKQMKIPNISDIISHSLDIYTNEGNINTVIKRNSPIPTRNTEEYNIKFNSENSSLIKIFEGDGTQTKNNYLLSKFFIYNHRTTLCSEKKINVTFDIDSNGILENIEIENKNGKKFLIPINLNYYENLYKEGIECLNKFKDNKLNERERAESFNNLESYLYDLRKYLKNISNIEIFENLRLTESIDSTIEWIKNNPNAKKEEYDSIKEDLENLYEKFEYMNNLKDYAYEFLEFLENSPKTGFFNSKILKKTVTSIIKWIRKNPNATKEEYDRRKENLKKLYEEINCINNINQNFKEDEKKEKEKIASKNELKNYAYQLYEFLTDESNYSKILFLNKNKVIEAINSVWKWIKNNPDANKKEYDSKKNDLKKLYKEERELMNIAKEEYKKKEKERVFSMFKLELYARYLHRLLKKENNDNIIEMINIINYSVMWIIQNPYAKKEEYDSWKEYLEDLYDNMIKENEREISKNNLENCINGFCIFLENERNASKFELIDKNYFIENINSMIKWINEEPNATKEEYDKKKEYLEKLYEKINCINKITQNIK